MAKSVLSKLLPTKAGGSKAVPSTDKVLVTKCPFLHELMTALVGPDDKPRQPCSVVIFAEDGVWKGCLSEKNLDMNLWASSDSLVGVLEALEHRLNADVIEWRAKPGQATRRK